MKIGDAVMFVDEHSVEHPALLTQVWVDPQHREQSAVNLVFVAGDETKTDQYGRQTLHATSVPHRTRTSAPGYFWR